VLNYGEVAMGPQIQNQQFITTTMNPFSQFRWASLDGDQLLEVIDAEVPGKTPE